MIDPFQDLSGSGPRDLGYWITTRSLHHLVLFGVVVTHDGHYSSRHGGGDMRATMMNDGAGGVGLLYAPSPFYTTTTAIGAPRSYCAGREGVNVRSLKNPSTPCCCVLSRLSSSGGLRIKVDTDAL